MATTTDWIRGLLAFTRCLRRSDADLQQHYYHIAHPASNGDSWNRWGSKHSIHAQRCEDICKRWERLLNPCCGDRVATHEYEFYRQSPESAAEVVRQLLKGREWYAKRSGQKRDAQTVDLRITFEDGGYTIHTAIPKINDAGDA